MFVEQPAVPPAHLVVRNLVGILDIVFFEDFDGFFVEVVANPGWCVPVLVGDQL